MLCSSIYIYLHVFAFHVPSCANWCWDMLSKDLHSKEPSMIAFWAGGGVGVIVPTVGQHTRNMRMCIVFYVFSVKVPFLPGCSVYVCDCVCVHILEIYNPDISCPQAVWLSPKMIDLNIFSIYFNIAFRQGNSTLQSRYRPLFWIVLRLRAQMINLKQVWILTYIDIIWHTLTIFKQENETFQASHSVIHFGGAMFAAGAIRRLGPTSLIWWTHRRRTCLQVKKLSWTNWTLPGKTRVSQRLFQYASILWFCVDIYAMLL